MKWPAKPAWWKRWYKYQFANGFMLSFNLGWALSHPDSPWSFLNWIGVGLMATLLGVNPVIFRLIETIRFMGKAAGEQHAAIIALMEANTQEIGQSIADHLNGIQRDDRPTTKLH